MAANGRLCWVLGVSVVLVALLASVSAHDGAGPSWFFLQPDVEGALNEQRLLQLGYDYRGRFGFFALVVADASEEERLTVECCPTCRVLPFAPHDSADELWVVESSDEWAPQIASALAANAMSFIAPDGSASFVVKNDITAIAQFSNVATFVPVATKTVVLADELADNPVRLRLAGMTIKAEPTIAKLVADVDADLVKKHDLHLSSYNSRLAISPGAVEAQEWIAQYYSSLGLVVSTEHFRKDYSSNVIAELPGFGDASKVVIIGAHYDSRSTSLSNPNMRAPGADDNASGTSAVLELARVFAQSGAKFNYTIRFASWSGEEMGLYGSRAYAAKAKAAGEDIVAALNADMIGYRRPNTPVSLALVNRYTTVWLTEAAEKLSRTYVPDLAIVYTTACCSDQQSFVENGYPGMSYFETSGSSVVYPHYHQSTDLPEYLDFEQMGLITKAAAAAIATFADPL